MKKRIIRVIGFFCIVSLFFVQNSQILCAQEITDEPDNLYARSAVLMDADSGRILFGKEEDVKRPMASTTKIMTCILALEHMEEGQIVSVSDYAVCQPKVRLGVRGKEKYYIRDLLYSMMLESHNDSAVVIAEGISGSVEAFAELMNAKAKELGCIHTHFVTPNGLDGRDAAGIHETTASDLARIMKYCIMDSEKKEEFLAITRTDSYQFGDLEGNRSFTCTNHNAFLTMMEGALSGKTGFTTDAGYCYVGALRQNEKTFIVALLACGWPNHKGYKWEDTKKLMQYGLSNYEYRDVWEETGNICIPVKNGVPANGSYSGLAFVKAEVENPSEELHILLKADEKVEVKKEIQGQLSAPVEEGQQVGKIRYYLDGKEWKSYNVIASESIEERNYRWCFQYVTDRFFHAQVGGQDS